MLDTLTILKSSKSNEWYTPTKHIELVRTVLGSIDLDPASSNAANLSVHATKIFTEDDGDLSWRLDGYPWCGTVYCNPPYGGLAGKFTDKALYEYKSGRMSAGVLCLSGYAYETKWFEPVLRETRIPICWVYRRVKFVRPEGKCTASTVGTIYVYLGPDGDIFEAVFGSIGAIR
jgi:hypothetical protein